MALPAAGNPLSISQIRAELLNTGKSTDVSLRYIGNYEFPAFYVPINQSSTNKPDLTNPFRIAEWYSYDHSAYKLCSNVTIITTPTLTGVSPAFPPPGTGRLYYKLRIIGNVGDQFEINLTVAGIDTGNADYGFIIYFFRVYPFDNSGNLGSNWFARLEATGEVYLQDFLTTSTQDYHIVFLVWDGIIPGADDPEIVVGYTGTP